MNIENAGHLKIALLAEGMRIDNEAKEGFGELYQEKIYSYSLTDWIDKKILLPSDIKLDKRVYVGFRFNNDSRWKLTKDSNKETSVLELDGEYVTDICLIPRPKYYNYKTKDGIPLKSIGTSCGNHAVSFFINGYCEYYRNNENCRFCGLVPTQKRFSDSLKTKKVEDVRECIEDMLELECPLDFIQLTGGSFYNHDFEARLYSPYIKTIKESLEQAGLDGKIPIHLTCMPPNNLSIIDELKENGLDTISFDLEFSEKKYFKKYCPGKSKSKGYDGIINALKYAKGVLGQGNVYSIIICGIEPPEMFVKGVEKLLNEGVIPTLNIYHKDPLSQMGFGNPDIEELIYTTDKVADLFKEYGVKAGRLGCAHYDIGHEIWKGYF